MAALPLRIVAIDDDAGDREILRRVLAGIDDWQTQFTAHADAETALAALRHDVADVILLDYVLGAHTGLETLDEIRQLGVTAPVIFLTGNGDESIAVRALRAGAADYLVKHTLSANSLRRAVSTALQRAALERELREERERLEVSHRDLTRRNEALRGFHRVLSHELRNPLGAALATVELLRDLSCSASAEQQELLALVEASCRQSLVQVEDLLDLSRMETGKFSLVRRPMDLAAVVRRVVKQLHTRAELHRIRLECVIADVLPPVDADEARIVQVLHNLVSNALKFTPCDGCIILHVADGGETAGGATVRVQDNGCGIPAEHLPRLFQSLYQVCEADSTERRGLGLGLSLCRELVVSHGGRIGVDSEVGVGSTFWFTLPYGSVEPDSTAPSSAQSGSADSRSTSHTLQTRR